MLQQDLSGAHGHAMYPQKFIRLVGCHEAATENPEAAGRAH